MGQAVVRAVAENPETEVAGGTGRPTSPAIGADVGWTAGLEPMDVATTEDPASLFEKSDVLIDFTLPEAAGHHAALASQVGRPYVVGTTGFDADGEATIQTAASKAPVVHAANFSLGVNLLLSLVRQAASALDENFDIEITEMHHRHKVDAPSGTALALGKSAAAGRDIDFDSMTERARDGATGPRGTGTIGFSALRGGDVAGEHSVIFAGSQERVELTHKATDRMIFARGAVKAALWAVKQPPGRYGMAEVLGLEKG
jgi:4-hydroxy-tetrahydrodipicolinate reductase